MVSGKYSALSGAISREQTIANISANLANVSTTGYKKSSVSFESLLRGEQQINQAKGINYDRIRQTYTDFSPGPQRQTENPLDLAISSEGFFKIQGPEEVLYTRRGDFMVDGEGTLRTTNGLAVLDAGNGQITIPDTTTGQIGVSEAGTIYLLDAEGGRSEVGQLAVVNIDDPLKLQRKSDTAFSLEQGGVENPVEAPKVVQGSLEISNVNITEEMTRMIDSHRIYETYTKVIKSYSAISEQQDELGTLG